jgi:hypothetical protein
MGKPSPPQPPDPAATISAQQAANSQSALQTAELNRVNQTTPLGTNSWSMNGTYADGTPIYSENISLSQPEQTLFNLGNTGAINKAQTGINMENQVANAYANPINTAGIPQITGQIANQSTPDLVKQAQDAAYKSQTQYLDPQFAQQQEALQSQLANQGIAQGSAAYNTAMDNFSRQKQAAYQSAQNAAVGQGDLEQNVLFGQGAQQANLQNAASQQAMSQLFALRNQPLNEYDALMSGTQVQQPNFPNAPYTGVNPTDVAGIINQGYQNQVGYYNAQMAPFNSLFSLGGSLGAAAIMG